MRRFRSISVLPGLGPGIQVFLPGWSDKQDVDGRDKPGHDGVTFNNAHEVEIVDYH